MLNKMCLLGEGFCIVEALIRRSFHVNIYLCTKAENLSPGQLKYLSRCVVFLAQPHLCTTEAGPSTLIVAAYSQVCVKCVGK